MKRFARLVPYPLIEAGRKLVHFGRQACPVCGARVRRFGDSGYGFPVLERLRVVGGMRRAADRCPVCHATARERLVWFYLSDPRHGLAPHLRIAHFAPEKGLTLRLRAAARAGYRAYDFEPRRYRHLSHVEQADLAALPMPDASVDLLICNHVIEHVPDPARAMAEIARVLAPQGIAILQVPIALALEETLAAPPLAGPAEREALLGQHDHLRLYCRAGYLPDLQAAGLAVEAFRPFERDAEAATRWRLDPFEDLFVCRKAQA